MPDAIANALRIASRQTERNPTDAQKEAGNYAKGKLRWNGLEIAIENPKGSKRSGVDKGGKRWECVLPAAYGYFLGTEAVDGDHVDTYIGEDHASKKVFVIDQVDANTGKYDEAKVMLSYPSKSAALADYEKAFSDGKAKDRIGAVTEMSVEDFKDWLRNGNTKKPLGNIRKGYATGGAVTMPLIKSGSKQAVSKNISAEIKAGKPRRQAIAIALDVARRAKRADGGAVTFSKESVTLSPADQMLRGYADGGVPDWRSNMDVEGGIPLGGPRSDFLREPARGEDPTLPIGERIREGILDYGPLAAKLATELTGLPGIARGTENILHGLEKGDRLQGAAGAGEVALGLIPGLALTRGGAKALSAMTNAPWRSGVAGGSLGVPQALLETREARAASLEERISQKLREMSPKELRDYQSLIGASPDGRIGPNTLAKAAAYESKIETDAAAARADADRKAQTERAIALERERQAGAAAIEAAKIKAEAEAKTAAETRKREEQTKLPFRELLPGVMPWLPVIAGTVAGLTGGAIKKSYANKYNRALDDLIPRWEGAVERRDPALASALKKQVYDLRAKGPGGTLPALAAGATEGTFIGLAPEEIDLYRGVPGAWERMTDLDAIGKRAGMAAFMGAGAAGLGSAKSAAKARKSENVTDLGPETDVMSGISAKDIAAAENLSAYEQAVSNARSRSRIAGAQDEARALSAEGDVRTLRQNDAELRLADSEARRRSSEPGAVSGLSEAAAPPRQRPRGEALPSPSERSPLSEPKGKAEKVKKQDTDAKKLTPAYVERALRALTQEETIPEVVMLTRDKLGRKQFRTPEGRYRGGPVTQKSAFGRALDIARKYATGGRVLAGPVVGNTGGREDAKPVDVATGSFVVPADIVSHLGTGNSLAGMDHLKKVFGESVTRASGGAVPIKISDGEYVLTPEQVAKIGGGDMQKGHKILDQMVLKLRRQHIDTLKGLPPPAKD